MMKVTLKNMDTGVIKTSPTGYSWTTLFFGFFPAIFRGDFKGAMIGLLGGLVGAWLFFNCFTEFKICAAPISATKPHTCSITKLQKFILHYS